MTINAPSRSARIALRGYDGAIDSAYSGGLPGGGTAALAWQAGSTIADGNTLTITTDGTYTFGTKATAAPLLYDNFESGSLGSLVRSNAATVGTWSTGSGDTMVTYSNAVVRTGTKAAKHDLATGGSYNASLCLNPTFTKLYLDFWIREQRLDVISRNWKTYRLFGPSDDLQLEMVQFCDSTLMNIVETSSGLNTTVYCSDFQANGQWAHFQLLYKESGNNVADGTIISYRNCSAQGFNSTAMITRKTNNSFNQIRIGHYRAQDAAGNCAANTGAFVYTDQVYVDTSWARVEIGNSSAYSSCTQREVQIPSAWAPTSVTVSLNLGTLTGDCYLFVIDENNNVISGAGVPITV